MAKASVTTKVPQGYKKINTQIPYFKFENPGDIFEGIFIESKETISQKFGNTQNVWVCSTADGELVQISEKATMHAMRLKLQKGSAFYLMYIGDQPNKKGGSPWKEFEMGIKE